MADAIRTNAPGTITMAQYEDVAGLLSDLKQRADNARQAQNPILLATYLDMLKVCTPRVARLRSRLDRQDLADLNRSLKTQRKEERAQAASNGTQP